MGEKGKGENKTKTKLDNEPTKNYVQDSAEEIQLGENQIPNRHQPELPKGHLQETTNGTL